MSTAELCEGIVAAIEAAVSEERERCAKIAESILPHPVDADVSLMDRVERWRFEHTRKTIAARIREPKRR